MYATRDRRHAPGFAALQAKLLRLELLNVKADLEGELGRLILHCIACGRTVHWVSGLGVESGHWAHAEPAPHGEPKVEKD